MYTSRRGRSGGDGGFEDVAGACEIHPGALLARSHDDEGEVDDDVGVGDQGVDRIAVQDVALPVFGLGPAMLGRIEAPSCHPDDPLDLGVALQRVNRRDADVAGWTCNRHRQSHGDDVPEGRSGETFAVARNGA